MRLLLVGFVAVVVLAAGAAPAAALDTWWLGRTFDGLPLTHDEPGLILYGDCDPGPGEGGCALPVEVQSRRTCQRNPVAIDIPARRLHRVRGGGIAAVYGDGTDLLTRHSTVTVYASGARQRLALKQLRRRRASGPSPTLARPQFPWPVLAELKRVHLAHREHSSLRAISKATGVSRGRVRVRLRMVELLGPGALADVAPPGISWRAVQHLRQVAFWVEEGSVREAMEEFGVTRAYVRRAVRRVRGLTLDC